jgi:hypothetical protein
MTMKILLIINLILFGSYYSNNTGEQNYKTITNYQNNNDTYERLVFTYSTGTEKELFLLNLKGPTSFPISIMSFTGSYDWSPNGQIIAIGCENPDEICFLDAVDLPDSNYPIIEIYHPTIITKNRIPSECLQYMNLTKTNADSHNDDVITSVSWASDNNRFAYVCRGSDEDPSYICIDSISGHGTCWTNSDVEKIYRIDWIPNSDDLLLSSAPDSGYLAIKKSDLIGGKITSIVEGWSPDLSEDGNIFYYFCKEKGSEKTHRYTNICSYNIKEKKETIVFVNQLKFHKQVEEFYAELGCYEYEMGCDLSLSSKKHIVFTSTVNPFSMPMLVYLDINTGQLDLLSSFIRVHNPVFMPQ